ncbi:MAG TPA: DUF2130 domain-containing protein [Burkholderiales bacterium]|nr:DUF2130 domain-containing protein [Burkholderiales bacterium]
MADQSISCPSCGKKIPLTRALRAEIEASVKLQFAQTMEERERELTANFERRLSENLRRAERDAAMRAEQALAREIADMQQQLKDQAKRLDEAREMELAMRRRERELEQKARDVELSVARKLDEERAQLVTEAEQRIASEHRLKDLEKERQLADMRRQIEHLKQKAEQGSQQLQGEAGETELETILRATFPMDEIMPVAQGARGADLHQVVVDSRGGRCGAILWECKNARHWSELWIAKLREDQRALRADVAILVTARVPRGCNRFTMIDGVLVTDFTCAAPLAAIVRANLLMLAQTRSAAVNKGEKLELLYRYLSGVEFRQRVEAIVEAFERMREDLDQERRAAERQWAKRAKQIEAVTCNISGMYGDLQGLVPALPSLARLELPAAEAEVA